MSWKSVEMQVALPRAQDAGKLQEQQMKQNQQFQESLAQTQLKEEELKRKQVVTFEDVEQAALGKNKEDPSQQQSQHQHNKENQPSDKNEQRASHPYLGKRIDLNG
ncbi:hypothetical protein DX933_04450 [Ornithinibacillus gellani]|uniref:hypothetical protein n=1 Tax=Ornithinibacillus gellani TaxID=2293253 RepID=UPI000F486422|nr:hypothetical protein [Ornithinibacillus gellani]TQS75534.1 hypothetical protein DX933_04450 [Ornithinibacillus gellani]